MNQRLQQFISAENISQAQFADTIGVARASVSHILAARNKPGFDFIESMALHYPNLNIEWLITGKGKMYKSNSSVSSNSPLNSKLSDAGLFDDLPPADKDKIETAANKDIITGLTENKALTSADMNEDNKLSSRLGTQGKRNSFKDISRIIIFYTDNTFRELK